MALELKKYMRLTDQVKGEAESKASMIVQLESNHQQALNAMRHEMEMLKGELDKVQGEKSMFERIAGQMKQEGAVLLNDTTELKEMVL